MKQISFGFRAPIRHEKNRQGSATVPILRSNQRLKMADGRARTLITGFKQKTKNVHVLRALDAPRSDSLLSGVPSKPEKRCPRSGWCCMWKSTIWKARPGASVEQLAPRLAI
jgi:hypothetical protein